jgi:hypothetical protein
MVEKSLRRPRSKCGVTLTSQREGKMMIWDSSTTKVSVAMMVMVAPCQFRPCQFRPCKYPWSCSYSTAPSRQGLVQVHKHLTQRATSFLSPATVLHQEPSSLIPAHQSLKTKTQYADSDDEVDDTPASPVGNSRLHSFVKRAVQQRSTSSKRHGLN